MLLLKNLVRVYVTNTPSALFLIFVEWLDEAAKRWRGWTLEASDDAQG